MVIKLLDFIFLFFYLWWTIYDKQRQMRYYGNYENFFFFICLLLRAMYSLVQPVQQKTSCPEVVYNPTRSFQDPLHSELGHYALVPRAVLLIYLFALEHSKTVLLLLELVEREVFLVGG
mmetsp:Transcript_17635/g.22862  ORF Transcript_17635/g.22862 Transcript_17635/m.22862 type:complete len:119 (-) Transcript_17635:131-487(-)